jgi:DNA ligase-associated metallophosphoesterase
MLRKHSLMRPNLRDRLMAGAKLRAPPAAPITIAQEVFIADVSGALWHEATRTLIVSDLHLEKGSSFARRGIFLPPYDTAMTLSRLAQVALRFQPTVIMALGDSFHDGEGAERLSQDDRTSLQALQQGRDWIWIAGNHDPDAPLNVGGQSCDEIQLGSVTLRHEPTGAAGELAGHLHPVARVTAPAGSVRRRCFVSDGQRCILPAFGALAGGLNIRDVAYDGLVHEPVLHVLGRNRVYGVPLSRCVPD